MSVRCVICSPHAVTLLYFFFFNDTATTEIYTLSLHDALPICCWRRPTTPPASPMTRLPWSGRCKRTPTTANASSERRSEEHTSELQSQSNLVCRLLLEKKKKKKKTNITTITT